MILRAPALSAAAMSCPVPRVEALTGSLPFRPLPATVRMVSPDGTASVDLGHTNADGQLTFTLPAQARADWEVQVDAGPGHRDYIELPGSAPSGLHGQALRSFQPLAHALGGLALLGTVAGLMRNRPRS